MWNDLCDCCYVQHGWHHYCNCSGGPTRSDPNHPLGERWPWINSTMGRNEKDVYPSPLNAARTRGEGSGT